MVGASSQTVSQTTNVFEEVQDVGEGLKMILTYSRASTP